MTTMDTLRERVIAVIREVHLLFSQGEVYTQAKLCLHCSSTTQGQDKNIYSIIIGLY